MWFLKWLRPSVEQQRIDCFQKMVLNQMEVQTIQKQVKPDIQKEAFERKENELVQLQNEYQVLYSQCEETIKPKARELS